MVANNIFLYININIDCGLLIYEPRKSSFDVMTDQRHGDTQSSGYIISIKYNSCSLLRVNFFFLLSTRIKIRIYYQLFFFNEKHFFTSQVFSYYDQKCCQNSFKLNKIILWNHLKRYDEFCYFFLYIRSINCFLFTNIKVHCLL